MSAAQYADKIISVEKALSLVKSNDRIITGLGAAEARLFLSRIHEVFEKGVSGVNINNCLSMFEAEYLVNPKYARFFELTPWFCTAASRKAQANGSVVYYPNHLHLSAIKRLQHITPDIYVGNASLPDRHGFMSLGFSNAYEKRVIEKAALVILEINPHVARTFGDLQISVNDVDYLIEADYPAPEMPDVEPTETDRIIGGVIANEIQDGDCIQLGVGGMPAAIAKALYGKKDLGVHTELLTSEMARLAKAGVITGAKKQSLRGKMVCTLIAGTAELYDFVDDNPSVAVMDAAYVNDPGVIALNDNQVSINATIEVDLTGQCASESIGHRLFSGTGGQWDTVAGAQQSRGGRSYICLHSTAQVKTRDGEKKRVSKIVPALQSGAVVSLSRNDVDRVVTEYGIAELRGTTVRERVERLVNVAHPDFREDLLRAAYEQGLLFRRPA